MCWPVGRVGGGVVPAVVSVGDELASEGRDRFAGGVALGAVSHHREYPAALLVECKGDRAVSVCLPARNEAATVGQIVASIRHGLVERAPLVDEILVVDDHSTDGTADVAVDAGAKVVSAADVLPHYGEGHGKGEALWKSVYAADGDLLVWCDADVANFADHFVRGLVGPLLVDADVAFVKGFYHRPESGMLGGGRVTELTARPLLSLFFPELAGVIQPLGGEFAARRDAVEQVPFVEGYGVDLALLIDIAARFGPASIAQVDLDERVDRNRSLAELGPQAVAVLQTGLRRAGVSTADPPVLRRPGQAPLPVDFAERPPMDTVPEYRARR
jgi:glucosyl-3-phosphoglycerate synthase